MKNPWINLKLKMVDNATEKLKARFLDRALRKVGTL
jgi:hypothetical protein